MSILLNSVSESIRPKNLNKLAPISTMLVGILALTVEKKATH